MIRNIENEPVVTPPLRISLLNAEGKAVATKIARPADAQDWKPTKPITVIVPWAAGGSTDQVIRVTASELEKALNQKVVVVNQPGGSGSIGTKSVLEGAKDGYTWAAGVMRW